jgi:hypothetical protein
LAQNPGQYYDKEVLAKEIWKEEYNPLIHDRNAEIILDCSCYLHQVAGVPINLLGNTSAQFRGIPGNTVME